MKLGRLLVAGAGAVVGAYLIQRRRRNLAIRAAPLHDHTGRVVEPALVELEGGETVSVIDAGDGPAIVMVPGLSGDREVYRYQIEGLTRSYRVIATNLRSGFDGIERNFDHFAHDIATVMDARGVRSAALMALSFGGPIGMRFAALYPERLRALILTATLARLDLSHVGLNRTLFIPLARWTSRFLPEILMRSLARVWGHWGVWVYDGTPGNERVIEYELDAPAAIPTAVGGLRMETFRRLDLRPELSRIRQPTLVIAGTADSYTPPDWQREIAASLPNATYVEIPGAGHLALISRAETFNQVVLEWLEEKLARGESVASAPSSETA